MKSAAQISSYLFKFEIESWTELVLLMMIVERGRAWQETTRHSHTHTQTNADGDESKLFNFRQPTSMAT